MGIRNLFHSLKPARSRTPIRPARSGLSRRQSAPCRLALETLEDRVVPAAMLTVGDANIVEGNDGTQYAAVVVSLTEPHGNNVTVNYSTVNDTATADSDYTAVSGKLTFTKNVMNKTILIPIRGDRAIEPDEYFRVHLANAKGAKIANGTGYVNIWDDEPRISISDAWAREGNDGTTAFTFTVSLWSEYDREVAVDWTTADGSAKAGIDYTADSGSLIFAANRPDQTSQSITVLVNGDRLAEPDRTFFVNLSTPNSYAEVSKGVGVGTIADDEPRISIGDVWNNGETSFTFTVSLSTAYDEPVTVDFATVEGTAIAGVDYVATFGTLTFAPGAPTTQTITVEVIDPTYAGWDKYFFVQLSGASTNALIATAAARRR
jgi:hypothetical protein